jgi:hypothetical protein
MSLTRRVFLAGLAAVLAAVHIPTVWALAKPDLPEDDFDEDDYGPPIEYLEVGEREEMLGGPATEPGWYLHPECMMGCCKSTGPFPSREAAVEADRVLWENIAKNSLNTKVVTPLTEEDLIF